jgi:hypothetical protein
MEFRETGSADHEQSPPHQRTHAAEHYAKLIKSQWTIRKVQACAQFTQAYRCCLEPDPRESPALLYVLSSLHLMI